MAGPCPQYPIHAGTELFQQIQGHKCLDRPGKASAMDAAGTSPSQQTLAEGQCHCHLLMVGIASGHHILEHPPAGEPRLRNKRQESIKVSTAQSLFGGQADAEHMPTTVLDSAALSENGIGILDALVAAGLAPSKGEARRLVQQGGISVDGEKVSDPTAMIPTDALRAGVVVKKGKKVYHKISL